MTERILRQLLTLFDPHETAPTTPVPLPVESLP
jgi:hypothetical protein